MNPASWHWGTWDEPLRLGPDEWAMVALAHAIVLGIAAVRYGLLERRRKR